MARLPAKPKPKPAPPPQGMPVPVMREPVASGQAPPGPDPSKTPYPVKVGDRYVPAPVFEGMTEENQLNDALEGEIARLGQQDISAQRAEFGTGLQRVQDDLAARLQRLQTERQRASEEQAIQTQEALRRRGQIEGEVRSSAAARGAAGSGGAEAAIGESQRRVDQQLAAGAREMQQGEEDFQATIQAEQQKAQRQLQDMQQERHKFERQIQMGELRGRAAEVKMRKAERGEASAWLNDRYSQLVAEGVPGSQARSLAISEARKAYPKVGDTTLVGALGTKGTKAEKPPPSPTLKKWGIDISVDSGKKMQPIQAQRLRDASVRAEGGGKQRPYDLFVGGLSEYLERAGDQWSPEGYVQYIVDDWVQNSVPRDEQGFPLKGHREPNQRQIRDWVGRNAKFMRVVLADAAAQGG